MRLGVALKWAVSTLCASGLCTLASHAEEPAPRPPEGASVDGAAADGAARDAGAAAQKGGRPARQGAASKSAKAKVGADHRGTDDTADGVYIEALAGGGYEVRWPGGCVTRYDKQGRPSFYGEPCDEPKIAESQAIVDSYRR